jgi:hypothetical protein
LSSSYPSSQLNPECILHANNIHCNLVYQTNRIWIFFFNRRKMAVLIS